MSETQRTTLVLRNERHSKQYNVELTPSPTVPDLWVVNFQYGAIGKALTPGTKTKSPASYGDALRIYTKLVNEKTTKRCDCCQAVYQEQDFAPAVKTPVAPGAKVIVTEPVISPVIAPTGFFPELYEPTDDYTRYESNDAYGAQRKYDGHRLSVVVAEDGAFGYNRKGEYVPLPDELIAKLAALNGHTVQLDGEWLPQVGEYVAWDLLECNDTDLRPAPYINRYAQLWNMLGGIVKIAELVIGTDGKRALLEEERAHNGEGVIYKKLDESYFAGRSRCNVKHKLWSAATVRICPKPKQDGKNSFGMEVQRLGRWFYVGTCTLTKTADFPESGTLREIKYLYVGAGNRLYQPEDLGPRIDLTDADCDWSQLKFKQANERLAA